MPASIHDADRRRRLRKELNDYMEANKVSCREIADYITAQREAFGDISISSYTVRNFLDEAAGKVGNKYVDAIEQFLEPQASGQDSRPLPASFFTTAAAFFGMIAEKGKQHCGPTEGTYTFYAISESSPSKISKGALEFKVVNQEFCVSEQQQSVPPDSKKPYKEIYDGHFLFRKDNVIALLREKTDARPKFYILSPDSHTDEADRKVVMRGVMMKFGERKSVFTSYVHLVRNDDAFDQCDVIPRDDVPGDILEYLDSQMWE